MKTKIKKWITFLFLACILIIAYATPTKAQYLPDEFTVGLWHLDKEFGTALDFDGTNDYVAIPDSTILEPSHVTVEAWVKRLGSPGNTKYIVSKHYGSGWNSYGLYTGHTGNLMFYIGTETRYYLSPDAGVGVWDGNWHHIAGTFDGAYVKLYIDGIEVGTGTGVPSGTTIAYNGAGLNIGGPGDPWLGGSYHFGGAIDEVRVSNVARTSFELLTPPTVDSYTVALWHFDDDPGQSAYDATNNGNDGQLGYTSETDDNDPTWIDSTVNSTLAIDSSPKENHGTIYGAAWADGNFGSALEFDGYDDGVYVADSPSLDFSVAITIEAWIYLQSYTNLRGHSIQTVAEKNLAYYLNIQSGHLSFYWYGLSFPGYHKSPNTLPLNTWIHVAATYNGSYVRLYENGVEVYSVCVAGTGQTSDWHLGIGYEPYKPETYPRYFEGIIDEVRISNVARASVDIDIKPGSDPNSICLSKQGLLPVAILSTDNFDATQIDPGTLALGGVVVSERGGGKKKSPKLAFSIEDVDEDGDLDMMAFFSVPELVDNGLDSTTTALELTGFLTDGTYIKGTDSVRIVPE